MHAIVNFVLHRHDIHAMVAPVAELPGHSQLCSAALNDVPRIRTNMSFLLLALELETVCHQSCVHLQALGVLVGKLPLSAEF